MTQTQAKPSAKDLAKIYEEVFNQYILNKNVLIVDANGTSRVGIANILGKMGVKAAYIRMAGDFATALTEMEKSRPHLVISEFDVGNRCGLELIDSLKKFSPDYSESLFVLITGNTSQSTVARAAEEDVDAFIIKPLMPGTVKATIHKAVAMKIDPPDYVVRINKGKAEMKENKIDQALKTFDEATALDSAPSLALFYHGQAQEMKKILEGAETDYTKGLNFNKIHYKCMVGLYENLMTRKRSKDAYEVVKKISQYFPANPQRMTQVLRLAIVTQSYEDVERYYQMFLNVDARTDEMVRYICAALVVCGKYYLKTNFSSRAFELFQKAAVTAAGRTHVLREIVVSLLEFNQIKKAEEYLGRFPADTRKSAHFLTAYFLVFDRTHALGETIQKGREILAENVNDPSVYRILIERSKEAGFNDGAEDLLQQAISKFPDQKETFQKAFDLTKKLEPAAKP